MLTVSITMNQIKNDIFQLSCIFYENISSYDIYH